MRLGDMDALLEAYDAAHEGPPGKARALILNAPTVDAVPVVRCSECRYWDNGNSDRELCMCKVLGTRTMPMWFCWAGLPWEDGETHG